MESYCKRLDGIICPNCTNDIALRLSNTEGVEKVKTSYIKSEVSLNYDSEKISESEIDAILAAMGFPAGKGRSNLLADLCGLLIIAALYFVLTYLTGVVKVPAVSEGMSLKLSFLVGLLGGFHCIGMCGGIMLTQRNAIGYNGGRLIGYTAMGFIFGAVGSYISFGLNLKCAVFIIAGGLVVLIGLQMWGIPILRRLKTGLNSPCGLRGAPFTVGVLTGIMPCGLLSSMWFVAAASGTAIKGAETMLVFGLGTCVCMLIFGLLGEVITRKYNKYILKASTMLIITMGLMLMMKGIALCGK